MVQLSPEQTAAVAAQMTVISFLEQEATKRKQELATGLFLAFGIDMLRDNWVFDPQGGTLQRVDTESPTEHGPHAATSLPDDNADVGQVPQASNG